MNSEQDNLCSHRLDFSIRKSPDHRLLASPRGLSQLATSFIAFLRQGIHTHALSSLTIKFTLHTLHATQAQPPYRLPVLSESISPGGWYKFVLYYARQYSIVKDLGSSLEQAQKETPFLFLTAFSSGLFQVLFWWAWVDSNYRPHPYQGCALTN